MNSMMMSRIRMRPGLTGWCLGCNVLPGCKLRPLGGCMHQVHTRLFIGTELDCRIGDGSWAVVHACKSPCHQRAVGYRGSLPSTHPNYLAFEKGSDLYLNMIDPPQPLFMSGLFVTFLRFGAQNWDAGRSLLIHCNLGESRAPSLAMLFLAKHLHAITNSGFDAARSQFSSIFPPYAPGLGIQSYLRQHWDEL